METLTEKVHVSKLLKSKSNVAGGRDTEREKHRMRFKAPNVICRKSKAN